MIKTGDLWTSAYLVLNGAEIENLIVSGSNGKTSVYFIFSGTDAERLNREFISGKAEANVMKLKTTMNHLKDLLFDKLRERKEKKNEDHIKRRYNKNKRSEQYC